MALVRMISALLWLATAARGQTAPSRVTNSTPPSYPDWITTPAPGSWPVVSVGVSESMQIPPGNRLTFDRVFVNEGGAWMVNGVFAVPRGMNGTYKFHFHSVNDLGSPNWFDMFLRGKYLLSVFGGDATYVTAGIYMIVVFFNCGLAIVCLIGEGNTAILAMNEFDTIDIRCSRGARMCKVYGAAPGQEIDTTFTGYRI